MSTAEKVNLYLIGVLQIFLGIASILFNGSAIAAIFKVQQDNRHYTILLHLCFADLLSNLTTQFSYTALLFMEASGVEDYRLCLIAKFVNISGLFLCFASFSLLLLATAERWFAILKPFRHERYKSSKIILILVAVVWVFSVVITAMLQIPYLSGSVVLFLLGFLILGGISISVAHGKILFVAHRVRKQIQQQSVSTALYERSDLHGISQMTSAVRPHDMYAVSYRAATASMIPNNSLNTRPQEAVTYSQAVNYSTLTSTSLAWAHNNSLDIPTVDQTASNEELTIDSSAFLKPPMMSTRTSAVASKTKKFENKTTASGQNSSGNTLKPDRLQIVTPELSIASNTESGISEQKANRSRPKSLKKISLAKLTAVLCATCLVCYIPFVICAALYQFEITMSRLLLHWMWTVLLISSTLLPVLFGFLNNELRTQIYRLWKTVKFNH